MPRLATSAGLIVVLQYLQFLGDENLRIVFIFIRLATNILCHRVSLFSFDPRQDSSGVIPVKEFRYENIYLL